LSCPWDDDHRVCGCVTNCVTITAYGGGLPWILRRNYGDHAGFLVTTGNLRAGVITEPAGPVMWGCG
jgi:hypothetical protein